MGMCTAETFNKYFTVAILTIINLLNYMDRFTLAGTLARSLSFSQCKGSMIYDIHDLI